MSRRLRNSLSHNGVQLTHFPEDRLEDHHFRGELSSRFTPSPPVAYFIIVGRCEAALLASIRCCLLLHPPRSKLANLAPAPPRLPRVRRPSSPPALTQEIAATLTSANEQATVTTWAAHGRGDALYVPQRMTTFDSLLTTAKAEDDTPTKRVKRAGRATTSRLAGGTLRARALCASTLDTTVVGRRPSRGS